MQVVKFLGFCFLASTATGCAGAATNIVAPTANIPVSLSSELHDEDGAIVDASRRTVVGKLDIKETAYAVLYSIVDLNPLTDISSAINQQVAASKGDAVANLEIEQLPCGLSFIYPLTMLPVWPGCVNVRVRGDIVRVSPKTKHTALEAQVVTRKRGIASPYLASN
jgi:hypothetical protein